ncbi:MAG: radical SAM protein [Eubacteriales bacterium]|nr:radical SAM protein [Eubacteriales bacterium]
MNRYVEPPLVRYIQQKASHTGTPVSGTFELTPLCNMECKMCYVRMSKEQMERAGKLLSCDRWLSIAADARKQGLLFLLLTGGEPLIYPDFERLYSELSRMGFVLQLNTNGTLITPQWVEFFKKNVPARMNITLYGPDDATYERLCGLKDGFSRVDRAIAALVDAGIPLKLNCSVTPHNVSQLEAICHYAKARNLELQVASYMFPPKRSGRTDNYQCCRLSPIDASQASAKSYLYLYGMDEARARLERIKSGESEPIEPHDDCAAEGDKNRCGAGRSAFWITWKGMMLSCGMMDCISADLNEMSFMQAWEQVKNRVADVRLPEKCSICQKKDLCQTCMAMVYCEEGNLSTVPAYRCKMADAYLSSVERTVNGNSCKEN